MCIRILRLIASARFEVNLILLGRVSSLFKSANLTINVEKFHFCMRENKYLGYLVGETGLRTDSENVSAITNFPIPKIPKHVRRFLEMTGYYQMLIINYTSVA